MSHQLPTAAVVVGGVVVGGAVVLVVVGVVEVVVDVAVGVVVVVVVVDFAQEAKINDVTMRQVNTIQIAPLFMQPPYLSWITSGKLTVNSF